MKINMGLFGISVIIILVILSIYYNKHQNEKALQELIIIKSLLEDLDNDIHEIEEQFYER